MAETEKGTSLLIIKQGHLSLYLEVLKLCDAWGAENGYPHVRVGNTAEGYYEILGFKTDIENEESTPDNG